MLPQPSPPQDLDELPPHTVLLGGRITIDVRVGRGGAATVYAATMDDGRPVALKIMSGECADDPTWRQRFRNEVALAQHLADHPRVVTPHEVGELPELHGRPYLTMPFIKGRSLLLLAGRLSVADAVAVMRDLSLTVADVHERGIVHRDIKPGNVIVQQQGGEHVPYLLDFGMAYSRGDGSAPATAGLTAAHELPGTKHYMAPEQILGAAAGPSFDVYALGVTLYEVLTGVCPLHQLGPSEAARYKCDASSPPLSIAGRVVDLPEELVRIVDAALERDPRRRIPSARELADRLSHVLERVRTAGEGAADVAGPSVVSASPTTEQAPVVLVALGSPVSRDPRVAHEDARAATTYPESERITEPSPHRPSGRVGHPLVAPIVDRGRRPWGLIAAVATAAILLSLLGLGLALLPQTPQQASEPAAFADRDPPPAAPAHGGVADAEVLAGSTTLEPPSEESPGAAPPSLGSAESDPTEEVVEPAEVPAALEPGPEASPSPEPERRSAPRPRAPPNSDATPPPSCTDVVAEARSASGDRQWRRVLQLTKSSRCWDDRVERLALRAEALLDLGRFSECAALERVDHDPEIMRFVRECQRQLDKDSSP